MNDFDYDVLQRKRLANQAKYRKRGSKSKKCPLSTDYMTQKQWKERCGEVMTYHLKGPMSWKEFKRLPEHIQKIYIEDIVDTYHANAVDLSKMFDVSTATILRHCGDKGLKIHFKRGRRMSPEQSESFEKFLRNESDGQDEEEKHTEIVEVQRVADPLCASINQSVQANDMSMTAFSISFSGKFNKEMLYNSLSSMVPVGSQVRIELQCLLEDQLG